MTIKINWRYISSEDQEMDYCRVLYAYVHPHTAGILYIGKADRCSVRERLRGRHKAEIFDYFFKEFQISEMGLLVGEIHLQEGKRYSSALLADIESLLISEIRPPANIQGISSRVSRPGLTITCKGDWPLEAKRFIDSF